MHFKDIILNFDNKLISGKIYIKMDKKEPADSSRKLMENPGDDDPKTNAERKAVKQKIKEIMDEITSTKRKIASINVQTSSMKTNLIAMKEAAKEEQKSPNKGGISQAIAEQQFSKLLALEIPYLEYCFESIGIIIERQVEK